MNKIKIKIGVIGYLPFEFNRKKIKGWRSELFDVVQVEEYNITSKRSDSADWGYTDALLNVELPKRDEEDIFIGITYVPIQGNYFARRLNDNRVVVSLFGIQKYLGEHNIPTENFLLRFMYLSVAEFLIEKNCTIEERWRLKLLHDDTRGCIFDMVGNRADIVYSLDKPKLCNSCIKHMQDSKVSQSAISNITNELKRIKKSRYYVIESFVKQRPILAMIITSVLSVVLGILTNGIYDFLKQKIC
ncbi:MAG: hypothetical protein SNH79_04355 [Rikenellaceae bacterium]